MSLLASSGSIPSKYLKVLLASPPKLQESLPLPLRRALMESDPARLFWNQAYWQALLAAYANDSARIESYNTVWPLEPMVAACRKVRKDGNGPTSSSNAAAVSPSAQALRGMLEWIGSSSKLYDFTCAQLRELTMAAERTGRFSEAQLWRSMRVDLIMRLHETDQEAKHHHHASTAAGSVGTAAASSSNSSFAAPHRSSHLASHIDHLHTWVWCLDAGSRDSGQLNQKLLEKLLGGESSPGLLATIKPKHVGRHCFAELSMLASHPAIVLTLLQSIVTALSQSVEKEITPKEHAQIKSLTNLLHLALSPVLPLLRTDAPVPPLSLPEPSNLEVLLTEFYPFVAELIIYAQLGEMEPLNPKLSAHNHPLAAATSPSAVVRRSLTPLFVLLFSLSVWITWSRHRCHATSSCSTCCLVCRPKMCCRAQPCSLACQIFACQLPVAPASVSVARVCGAWSRVTATSSCSMACCKLPRRSSLELRSGGR